VAAPSVPGPGRNREEENPEERGAVGSSRSPQALQRFWSTAIEWYARTQAQNPYLWSILILT